MNVDLDMGALLQKEMSPMINIWPSVCISRWKLEGDGMMGILFWFIQQKFLQMELFHRPFILVPQWPAVLISRIIHLLDLSLFP